MTTTPARARLRAVTRELPGGHDALDNLDAEGFAWLHHETRIVTSGVAARLTPDEVGDALLAIATDDTLDLPGTGPLAVGALPFDPAVAGDLVVPSRITASMDGRTWRTDIAPIVTDAGAGAEPPTRFTIAAARTRDDWRVMVADALAAIRRDDFEKVVLAREIFVESDAPFDVAAIARRLVSQQPGCFVYSSHGLVGASPELLVRRSGDLVESLPVAGTAVADGDDASLRALAASVKDHREHRFVVDAIVDVLTQECDELDAGTEPHVAVFGHVAHLATRVHGRLRAPARSALELAQLLHPTPAVGGTPGDAALDAIRSLERFDRGRYAGPVGWVDARGNGEWAIALRGAEVEGCRARLVAGAGIVEGSDPDSEWAETQAKLEPMLRALVRV
jgi:menaquinone-specific isochorismate synthase